MKRGWVWGGVAVLLALAMVVASRGEAAPGEKRVALVIGNSDYVYAGRLDNPVNDASDVAAALTRLDFQVTPLLNGGGSAFASAVDDFMAKARGADVAVFYYAGHGLQFDGASYLLPTDARLENEFAIKREAFAAQDIVAGLENAARASIVVLDACRNNPLAEQLRRRLAGRGRAVSVSRGLGRLETTSGETLIVYSASPGQVAEDGQGRNSPFTAAFLKHVETPGLEVEQMLKRVTAEVETATAGKQQPERLSRLKIELWLKEGRKPQEAGEPGRANDEARDIWLSLKDTTSEAQLQQFASDFRATPFAHLAEARIRELKQRAAEILAAACTRLAGSPYDEGSMSEGVELDQIDAVQATIACRKAVATSAGEPRLMFQLGRALHKKGDFVEAREWYEKAAEKGIAGAITNLGGLYARGNGVTQDYARARERYEAAAARGFAPAMANLGYLYDNGQGVAQDYAKAREWYEMAVARGNARAMTFLCFMYYSGHGVARNHSKARDLCEKAAARGDAHAMRLFGHMHDTGQGAPQDYVKAREWYEKAAARDDGPAMRLLGNLHYNAHGAPQDYAKAREWYEKAAGRGDAPAETTLGFMYDAGQGVTQNYARAREFYEKAAGRGDAQAMVNLGFLYDAGHGVAQDYARARDLYEKAAAKGHAPAMRLLGNLSYNGHGVAKDYAKAREWYEKAAAKGDGPAEATLGFMYDVGQGVAQDYARARDWYEKAAARGNAPALRLLGALYFSGHGVAQDYVKAREWYEKAAAKGDAHAMNNLGLLYKNGWGVKRDYAKAREFFQAAASKGNTDAQKNLRSTRK